MRITRLYSGADHRSHFEEIEVPLAERRFGLHHHHISHHFAASALVFHEPDAPQAFDFYTPERRQFFIPLAGLCEIEVGDGTKRLFRPGDIIFADDTSGQGHITREVEGPRRSVFVQLPDDFDVGALAR